MFSFEDYEAFKEALMERRQLTLALTQERQRREFAEKQLEVKNQILNNSLIAIQKSLDNVQEGLNNTKREQYLKYEASKKSD